MYHRRWTHALLLLVLVFLVACGGDATEEGGDEAATEEPVTVVIGYNRFMNQSFGPGPAPIEVIQEAVAKKYPYITVQLNITPDSVNQMHDALVVWFTAEDPTIDIYGMDTPWVMEFGEAEWAVPLNEELPALEENFLDVGLDVFTYEGQRLGVPYWGSISGLFYRTDLLEEYGYEPPESYDDLVTAAEEITADRPELTGFTWAGAREEGLVMVWAEFLHGFGGRYFDAEGQCAFNSPEGVEAVEFMLSLIESGVSPRETTSWGAQGARTRFVEGEAIFLRHNHDIITWLDDEERSDIAGRWDFMPNPAQPDGRPTGVTGGFAFAINPYTDEYDAALKVLEVIASEEVQRGFAIAWGPVQYYEGLYEDTEVQEANPNVDELDPVLETALNRPPSTRYAELSSILQEEIHSALSGTKPVEQALDDACARVEELGEE